VAARLRTRCSPGVIATRLMTRYYGFTVNALTHPV
jgi:hypothetical protein